MKTTIGFDVLFHNRQEAEEYWTDDKEWVKNQYKSRSLRIIAAAIGIVLQPLELIVEILLAIIAMWCRTASILLFATNPIDEQTDEEDPL